MIVNKSLVLCAMLLVWGTSFTQSTIYSENFTDQNDKGAIGPTPTIDVNGVSWDIDVSQAALTAGTDWFKVTNNQFEARDVDGTSIWFSPVINIDSFTNVEISVNLSEFGSMESTDFIKSEYRIDGGSWKVFDANGNINEDFDSIVAAQYSLTGSILEIRISVKNNGGDEYLRFDDVLVKGVSNSTNPNIITSTTSLTNLDYTLNSGPSAEQTFSVSGSNLNSSLNLSAPVNFEISTTLGSGFVNSLSLTPSGGAVNSTTIYCRLKSGLVVNNYSGNITVTSTSATTQNISVSGEVTPLLADVVITEIMYNSSGTDDEWIEICNVSGDSQNISGYKVKVASNSLYTFPSNTVINHGDCITVMLGTSGDSIFNPDCPFTPDYGNTTSTDNLVNSSRKIELIASDNLSIVDEVTYFDGNGGDGNGPSLHIIDIAVDNSSTSFNWQEVLNGGSPGIIDLESPCSVPELQIKNSSGTIQSCGSFVMDFGTQAVGFNTDLTFEIENDGTTDLIISSIAITGDFSIISPSFPFTIPALNSADISVRFTPSLNGSRTASLTINNNDSDEGNCIINLEGEGYTPVAEINVEGDVGTFPDIFDGDTTPSGTDNTLFAAQFIGSSQTKSYIINNEGTADLTVSGINITGIHAADFEVTLNPDGVILPSEKTFFEITFTPSAVGNRSATISIINNDDDENPFNFAVKGEGLCVSNSNTLSPSIGPPGTIVTITGTDLNGAAVTIGGMSLSPTYLSDTALEITIPDNAVTSNVTIMDSAGCTGNKLFTVVDNRKASCDGGSYLNELFISEVTDATYGSLTYIEIYNPTANAINLSDYSLSIYANGNTDTDKALHQSLSGIIQSRSTYVVTTGINTFLNDVCNVDGGNGNLGNLVSNELAGINKRDDGHDFIGLYKSSILIDSFGEFGDKNWMDNLHTTITGDRGFNFKRLNIASNLPNSSFDDNDWFIIDWVGSGTNSCVNNDYSDIGNYDFFTGKLPSVTLQPTAPISECEVLSTITVEGTQGVAGGMDLSYQWFYNAPGTDEWIEITASNSNHSGQQTAELKILDLIDLNGYQYYAQIREDNEFCFVATKAVRFKVTKTLWNGSTWTNGSPTDNSIAIINGNYNTSTHGSFSACQLFVQAGAQLIIDDFSYVEISNNVKVSGTSSTNPGYIIVRTAGSFVQLNDFATVNLQGTGKIEVEKVTSPMMNHQEYTYWSSPVANEEVDDALVDASSSRKFYFNAQNYRDSFAETNNNNESNAGHDDIDDNGDDWTFAGGLKMEPGAGYASTHKSIAFSGPGSPPYSFKYVFDGAFNNGIISVPIYRNDAELNDRNWNFVGNPYPSPISALDFLTLNPSINGAVYLWSHGTSASGTNNGNEVLNFSQSDYAVINGSGSTAAGGENQKPSNFIPSGQGFFVEYKNNGAVVNTSGNIKEGAVIFNNSLRTRGTNDNKQFFRVREQENQNKIWLNLTTSTGTGVFNQILIAYVEGATIEDDGGFYDAVRNLSVSSSANLNSLIETEDEKGFIIQGRNPLDLNSDELIRLSFSNYVSSGASFSISLDEFQGKFMHENPILIKDNNTGILHDLKTGEFTFTSDIGQFNDRFEIIFHNSSLSDKESEIAANDIKIIELSNGDTKFKSELEAIKTIEIFDLRGRKVYTLNLDTHQGVFKLDNLSLSTYIARFKLESGKIIAKQSVKLK